MPLVSFRDNQRVRVCDPEHPLHQKAGTVVRLRRADIGAWVNMDDAPPTAVQCFPADDHAGRANHIILYPAECETA